MKFLAHLVIAASLGLILAIGNSTTAIAASPQSYDKLISEGKTLELEGEKLAPFIDYYQASLAQPTGADAIGALTRLLHDGLPTRIPQFIFDAPQGPNNPLKLDSMLNGQVLAISPQVGEIAPITDPQNNWPFTRLTYFYRQSTKPEGDWVCYAIVHSQTADDQDMGVRMGRLLFLLREALIEKTTYLPLTDGKPFGVWLTRHAAGTAGGEMWQNNIYFYDVTTARSQIEWIREVAHEYSHLALPAIGGDYTDPEPWANGYYGERLLLRWLHRGAAGGQPAVEDAWGATFAGYVNFDKLLIGPYLADFNAVGMSRIQLGRHDGEGMRYLIGMLLEIDDHAGPKVLGDMLWSLPQSAQVDPLLLYQSANDALEGPAYVPPLETPPINPGTQTPAPPPVVTPTPAVKPPAPTKEPAQSPSTAPPAKPKVATKPAAPRPAVHPKPAVSKPLTTTLTTPTTPPQLAPGPSTPVAPPSAKPIIATKPAAPRPSVHPKLAVAKPAPTTLTTPTTPPQLAPGPSTPVASPPARPIVATKPDTPKSSLHSKPTVSKLKPVVPKMPTAPPLLAPGPSTPMAPPAPPTPPTPPTRPTPPKPPVNSQPTPPSTPPIMAQ